MGRSINQMVSCGYTERDRGEMEAASNNSMKISARTKGAFEIKKNKLTAQLCQA